MSARSPPTSRLTRRIACQMRSNAENTRPRRSGGTWDWITEENVTLPVEVPRP